MQAEAWVHAGRDIQEYLSREPGLFDYPKNVKELFRECVRPHFKFFWKRVEHKVTDANLDSLRRQAEELLRRGKVVFLTRGGWGKRMAGTQAVYEAVEIEDSDMFGNVEPVWRKIRLELNRRKFDAVLVNLGLERGIVIPRIVQVYGVPACDVSPFAGSADTAARERSLGRRLKTFCQKWFT